MSRLRLILWVMTGKRSGETSKSRKTARIFTVFDGVGVIPEVFLLGWSLDRLSVSFWVLPTCFVIASLVVNLLFPLAFFPFSFFAKKLSNCLSCSDIAFYTKRAQAKRRTKGTANKISQTNNSFDFSSNLEWRRMCSAYPVPFSHGRLKHGGRVGEFREEKRLCFL